MLSQEICRNDHLTVAVMPDVFVILTDAAAPLLATVVWKTLSATTLQFTASDPIRCKLERVSLAFVVLDRSRALYVSGTGTTINAPFATPAVLPLVRETDPATVSDPPGMTVLVVAVVPMVVVFEPAPVTLAPMTISFVTAAPDVFAKAPMMMLLVPVVSAAAATYPMTVLLPPVVTPRKPKAPKTALNDAELMDAEAMRVPQYALLFPLVNPNPVWNPARVLSCPVVRREPADAPAAVLYSAPATVAFSAPAPSAVLLTSGKSPRPIRKPKMSQSAAVVSDRPAVGLVVPMPTSPVPLMHMRSAHL